MVWYHGEQEPVMTNTIEGTIFQLHFGIWETPGLYYHNKIFPFSKKYTMIVEHETTKNRSPNEQQMCEMEQQKFTEEEFVELQQH